MNSYLAITIKLCLRGAGAFRREAILCGEGSGSRVRWFLVRGEMAEGCWRKWMGISYRTRRRETTPVTQQIILVSRRRKNSASRRWYQSGKARSERSRRATKRDCRESFGRRVHRVCVSVLCGRDLGRDKDEQTPAMPNKSYKLFFKKKRKQGGGGDQLPYR